VISEDTVLYKSLLYAFGHRYHSGKRLHSPRYFTDDDLLDIFYDTCR